jgi:hypothetical protein
VNLTDETEDKFRALPMFGHDSKVEAREVDVMRLIVGRDQSNDCLFALLWSTARGPFCFSRCQHQIGLDPNVVHPGCRLVLVIIDIKMEMAFKLII